MAAMTEISVSQAVYTTDKKIDVGLTNVGYRGYVEEDCRPRKTRRDCECECAYLHPGRGSIDRDMDRRYDYDLDWERYEACIANCLDPDDDIKVYLDYRYLNGIDASKTSANLT